MMAEASASSEASQIDFQCPVANVKMGGSNNDISIRTVPWSGWTFAMVALFLTA